MKTLKAIPLMLAMLLFSLASSAYDFEVGGIYYNIFSETDKTVEVTSGNVMYTGDVTIPSTVVYNSETYSVTGIRDGAFEFCRTLTSVGIPDGVKSIGRAAFRLCSAIGSVIIPYGVLCIERSTFAMCTNLTFVNIPNSVTIIEGMAFRDCTNLSSIIIPEHVTSIGVHAFSGCSILSSVTSLATVAPILAEEALSSISPDATLYIPSGSEADYEAKGWYKYFSRVETFVPEEHISDGTLDEYVNESERGPIDIHYTRTLPNLAWNPLYVPFDIPCSALSGKYDVAYINSLHSYDYDDDGTIDNMTVEVVKIPSGTLKANYPYLIRARSDEYRSMHLVLEDATLYRTEENGIDCSSVYNPLDLQSKIKVSKKCYLCKKLTKGER